MVLRHEFVAKTQFVGYHKIGWTYDSSVVDSTTYYPSYSRYTCTHFHIRNKLLLELEFSLRFQHQIIRFRTIELG
jgi:hypothetical protein